MVLDTLETLKQEAYSDIRNPFISNFQSALEDYNSGLYRDSLRQLNKIRKKIKKLSLKENEFIVATNVIIGNNYAKRREFSNAIIFYKKALKIDPDNIPAKNNLMLVFIEQERYPDAISMAQELEKIVQSAEDYIVYSSLGKYYAVVKKDLDKSLEYDLKAIKMEAKTWVPYSEALFIYDDYKKDYQEAFKIYALAESRGLGNIPDILNNYAYALLKYNNLQEACNILNKIDIKSLMSRQKAIVTATWGLYYFKADNLDTGKKFYEEAVAIADAQFSNLVKQKYLLELGNYYYERGKILLAEEKWKESLNIMVDEKFFSYRKDVLENLLELEKQKKLSRNNYIIKQQVVSRYKKFIFIFVGSFLFFVFTYILWIVKGLFMINPFFSLIGMLCSLVLFSTCMAGIASNTTQ